MFIQNHSRVQLLNHDTRGQYLRRSCVISRDRYDETWNEVHRFYSNRLHSALFLQTVLVLQARLKTRQIPQGATIEMLKADKLLVKTWTWKGSLSWAKL